MKITDALAAEHAVLLDLFEAIEQSLSKIKRLDEVQRLARLIERMLRRHAAVEEDLVLVALDHLPAQQRRADRFHREHQELDAGLKQALAVRELAQARRLLLGAIRFSRAHFLGEERALFPLLDRIVPEARLRQLARVWRQQRQRTHDLPYRRPRLRGAE